MTRWVLISDVQFGHWSPQVTDNDERARMLIQQVVGEAPDFVVNGGDHINGEVADGNAERQNVRRMWAKYHRAMRPLAKLCPVISVVGNHDQTGQAASSDVYCRQTQRAGKPTYYSATIRGVHVHVIALDVVPRRHRGGFPDWTVQAKWLGRDLNRRRRAKCTVAVGHYPIFLTPKHYDNSDPSLRYDEGAKDEGVLLPMLLDVGVDLYLCGHHHVYERTRYRRLTQVMAGAADMAWDDLMQESPNRYCRVLDERQCYVRFTLKDKTIRAEAVALDGDVVDAWTQRLNGG